MTEKDKKQEVKKPAPHVIHNGSKVARCSECGQVVNIPQGTCFTCPNCLAQFGGCG